LKSGAKLEVFCKRTKKVDEKTMFLFAELHKITKFARCLRNKQRLCLLQHSDLVIVNSNKLKQIEDEKNISTAQP